jgi:hypothetical protein
MTDFDCTTVPNTTHQAALRKLHARTEALRHIRRWALGDVDERTAAGSPHLVAELVVDLVDRVLADETGGA